MSLNRVPLKNKHVLLVFDQFPPDDNAVAIRAKYFCSAIVSASTRSHSTGLICRTKDPTPMYGVNVNSRPDLVKKDNNLIRILNEFVFGLRTLFFIFLNPVYKVIVVSTPGFISFLIAALGCIVLKKSLVVDVRDDYPYVYSEAKILKKDSVTYKFFDFLKAFVFKRAKFVSFATRSLADVSEIHQKGVFYNGFPAYLSKTSRTKLNRFTCCFHGLLGKFQDVEGLLELAELLESQNIKLRIIGYGEKSHYIEGSKLTNIEWYGRMRHDETLALIAECHVGISLRMPGHVTRGAIPVKVWEYVGIGLPVVSSPPSEVGDLARVGYQITEFDYQDYHSMANKIATIKKNYESGSPLSIYRNDNDQAFQRENIAKAFAKMVLED